MAQRAEQTTLLDVQDGPTRVMLVDDHAVVRQGLRTFLDLQEGIDVVGEIGAPVKVGDPLLRVYFREPKRMEVATLLLTAAIQLRDERAEGLPLFIETVDRTSASKAFV